MNNQYTTQARNVIALAEKAAVDCSHSYIGTEHLLIGLLRERKGTAAIVLSKAGVSLDELMEMIVQLVAPDVGNVLLKPTLTPMAQHILQEAVEEALSAGLKAAGTEHILIAILKEPDCVATKILYTMGVKIQKLYLEILRETGASDEQQKTALQAFKESGKPSATPVLDQYSRDLTEMAKSSKLDPVIGRDKEIERVVQILSRRKKNNPCLIGEPGVGKTAIVEGLAERIVEGSVPETVRNKRLLVLDLSAMVAGSKYRGEFEERIKKVLAEVTGDSNILLFIDEIHTIIGAGGAEGALDASNILKPSLARGELQLIGATTIDEYRKHIEKDAALERRFQPVTVEEPSEEETVEILRGLRPYYEEHHQVNITNEALRAAVTMSERYINDRFLPDKAIDLIDEASSRVRLGTYRKNDAYTELMLTRKELENAREEALKESDFPEASLITTEIEALDKQAEKVRGKRTRSSAAKRISVTEKDIASCVASWTGIPVEKIAESESRRLAKLETILHKRVIGQDEAVTAVARAVRRGRVGLKDPNRPIGSFLFLGPTGVGKTELSKALAEAVFGSEEAMIRVDMSEYMEKHSVSKLIGSPPGYVGYEEGGQLSEKVRRHPYSVLLFDEIEKAHPDVFNILLQVLDDGHITDAQGRKVSFKETIIIMTSNAGASSIMQPKHLGFLTCDTAKQDYDFMKNRVMEDVKQQFRPEFLNRIDEILVFHALTKEDMKAIVNIQLKDLIARAKAGLGITLKVTAAVKENLIEKSYDNKYGARPLKRAIQSRLEDPLAEEILNGRIKEGDIISAKLKDEQIVFAPQIRK